MGAQKNVPKNEEEKKKIENVLNFFWMQHCSYTILGKKDVATFSDINEEKGIPVTKGQKEKAF